MFACSEVRYSYTPLLKKFRGREFKGSGSVQGVESCYACSTIG